MKLLLTLVMTTSFLWSASAQEFVLTGTVQDAEDSSPVTGATILLVNVKDSTLTHNSAADDTGRFRITKLSQAFYKLTITSIAYEPYATFVRITEDTDLKVIRMNPDTRILEEVQVKGQVVPVEVRGDTTSMAADAYKTNPDATAEDLVAKMPGIIVNQGQVQAQGESVQKVLVDGKEFFSNDPSLALKNIPAEIIDKIEVFDQQSEQSRFSGFDDGNTTKTINIVTRQEMRDGEFGRIYAGAGTDQRYSIGGNFNSFDESRRISVLGMLNNINQQNFSGDDLLGVASGRSSRGRRGGGGMGGGSGGATNFTGGQQNGISDTKSFGINIDEEVGEKLKINGSYFFNRVDNDNIQLRSRETFLGADSSQIYDESSSVFSMNRSHRVNFRIEYDIDERNSVLFTPSFNYQDNNSDEFINGFTMTPAADTVNSSVSDYQSERNGFTANARILYRHRFEKRGRTFSVNLDGRLNDSEGESLQASANRYFLSGRSDSINQLVDTSNPGRSFGVNINYTEPLGERMQLQMGYEFDRNGNDSQKETFSYDPFMEVRQDLDTALSNNFTARYEAHRPVAGLMWRMDKLFLRAGISFQHAILKSEQEFPQTGNIERTFNNVLPSLMMRYTFSRTSNLRIFYRTSTDAPSVGQLQNVVDNTNPLFLSIGNPSLQQSRTNFVVSRYSSTNPDKSTTFFLLGMVRNTADYVTNTTYIVGQDSVLAGGVGVNEGTQISLPVNVNGYWNIRSLATYGFPVTTLKSNLNTTLGLTYVRTPGLINQQENVSNSYNVTGGLVVASNISERVDFTLSYNADYTIVRNTLQPELEDDYIQQSVGARVNLIFGKGFVFRTDISFLDYSGYSDESLNQNFTLWNASIGKKFLKEDRGEFKISVFDLLKENVSIARVNTESYFEESRTNVLQQYFMATFTYTVRNFTQGNGERENRWGGGGRPPMD